MANNLGQDWEPVVWTKKKSPKKDNKSNSNTTKNKEDEEIPVIKKIDADIKKYVRDERTKYKMKQDELAKALNVPKQKIEEIENGKGKHDQILINKIKRYFISKNNKKEKEDRKKN